MIKIPVITDETGCAIASQPIPETAVATVMTSTEVTVYEEGDELPTFDTWEPGVSV